MLLGDWACNAGMEYFIFFLIKDVGRLKISDK